MLSLGNHVRQLVVVPQISVPFILKFLVLKNQRKVKSPEKSPLQFSFKTFFPFCSFDWLHQPYLISSAQVGCFPQDTMVILIRVFNTTCIDFLFKIKNKTLPTKIYLEFDSHPCAVNSCIGSVHTKFVPTSVGSLLVNGRHTVLQNFKKYATVIIVYLFSSRKIICTFVEKDNSSSFLSGVNVQPKISEFIIFENSVELGNTHIAFGYWKIECDRNRLQRWTSNLLFISHHYTWTTPVPKIKSLGPRLPENWSRKLSL